MSKVDVKVRQLRDGYTLTTVRHIPERRPNVTRKTLIDLVNAHLNGDGRAVSVHHPYLKKDQVEHARFCPRVLVRVEHPVRGYYVAMGFTCYDATREVRAGKTLQVITGSNGPEIVAV